MNGPYNRTKISSIRNILTVSAYLTSYQNHTYSTFLECRSSKTDDGGKIARHYGQLDTQCKFPFSVKGKMYYSCTYDYSHLTGNRPWCSVDTDEDHKHHGGRDRIVINGTSKKFWGVCDDNQHCNIPTKCK